jgi:hypothetical protein
MLEARGKGAGREAGEGAERENRKRGKREH